VNHQPADPGYQRGDRIALEHTTDPYTRLTPGTQGTVTGYDPRHGQFSNRRASRDSYDLLICVADVSVTLTGGGLRGRLSRLGSGHSSSAVPRF